MSVPDEGWRTQTFRQGVIARIDEAIRTYGMSTSRNSIEMENHVFQKAKSREEYLGFVARLILHVRDMNNKKTGMQGAGQPQAGGMPDPINALQNLASQGTRNNQMLNMNAQQNPMGGPQQQMGVNVFQAMARGPGGAIPNMQGNMQNRMGANGSQMGNQMNNQMGTMNQMGGQMSNQMPQSNMNQLGGSMQNTIGNQLQGNMPNQMGNQQPGQMQMNPALQNTMGSAMMGFSRNPTPTQFLQQSPSSSVQSPGMSGPPTSNQMVTSPALAPSPGSSMTMMGSTGPPRSIGMAPSPGTSLNTPGQPIQSPMGLQEEQAYREKVRQLSKYIDPLRKMIARIGNDGEHVEKLSKMKKLLEILSNPQQRMPLETLLKCEVVLEKLDFKRSDGNVPVASGIVFKESHIFSPLLEAISSNAQNSVINHTLHRTFGPTLDALFGPEVKLVPPLTPQKFEEPTSDIPDVLQGEIARLDQRFKVSLDTNQQPGSKSIQLMCWLDDRHLPCVPPISITVPEDYPVAPPKCHTNSQEYNATSFLSAVEKALLGRIQKLPKYFSVSQLLDTWEMSVRQAASGNNLKISTEILMMGL
ncbi:hypothetical protein HHI36_023628 [Cryptolaemus montrouzieri]